jgi:hypothetical protein
VGRDALTDRRALASEAMERIGLDLDHDATATNALHRRRDSTAARIRVLWTNGEIGNFRGAISMEDAYLEKAP